MEEEEPDFELLENPARVLPAQVCCCDFGMTANVTKCQNKMLMSYFRPINRATAATSV